MSRKNYYCCTAIAVKYGADAAILLHEFVRMCEESKTACRDFHKDRYWTCVSLLELSQMYPAWSKNQIERSVKKLREGGALLVDNFNIDPRDRTNWYSPSDETLSLYEGYQWDREE